MKVIGAGFGRTGTMSLKAALEELGFGPCYHMFEVSERPEHILKWRDYTQGKSMDWKRLFEGFQSTVDWPACIYYRELMEVFPDAKVLLSVRDPEKWYESTLNTLYRVGKTFPISVLGPFLPPIRRMRAMVYGSIWDGTFSGKFEQREHAIEVFKRHIEEVKRHVPPERLLVYEVKQGWEPLCRFLGVPVPVGKPFPHINDTADFKRKIRELGTRVAGPFIAVALAVVLAVFLTCRG